MSTAHAYAERSANRCVNGTHADTAAPIGTPHSDDQSTAEATERTQVTDAPGIIRYHGVAALVAGLVKDGKVVIALEVLGNEVAVKAVVNGLISIENRSLETTGITIDSEAVALDPLGHYRMVTTPLSAGKVSCIVLHQDSVVETPQHQPSRRRRRQVTEATSDAASYGVMAGREQFVFVTLAGDTATTTAPDGFSDMFASVLPLPSKREWADQLFQHGIAEELVTPLDGHGTLAGYRVSLNLVAWHAVIGEVVRNRVSAATAQPARPIPRGASRAHRTV